MSIHVVAVPPLVLVAAILAAQGPPAEGPGGSASYSGYGGASSGSSYGGTAAAGPSRSQGSSGSTYRRSTNTYGTSRNTYGRSTNTYGAARDTYGNSSRTTSNTRGSQQSASRDYGNSTSTYGTSTNRYSRQRDDYHRARTYRQGNPVRSVRSAHPSSSDARTNWWSWRGSALRVAPVFVRGRVLTQEREPIRDAVLKLNCGGASYPLDYTDRNGYFNVIANRCFSALAMNDASLRSTRTVLSEGWRVQGCWLEATAPGYTQTRFSLARVSGGRSTDLGTAVLRPITGTKGHTVHVSTYLAPKGAQAAYRKGLRALRRKKPDYLAAQKHLWRAVEIHGTHAPAWSALGETRMALGDRDGAEAAFGKSVEIDPTYLPALEAMLMAAVYDNQWERVESRAGAYLKLSPTSSSARFYQAVASFNLAKYAEVESVLAKMKDYGEQDQWPMLYFMQGMVHRSRAEFESSADQLQRFLDRAPTHQLAKAVERMLYEWSMLQVIESRPHGVSDSPPAASRQGSPAS